MGRIGKKVLSWMMCLMMAVGMLPISTREAKASEENEQTCTIRISVVDADDNSEEIRGAVIKVTKDDDNTLVDSGTTDENGTYEVKNVKPGNYIIKEVSSPYRYNKVETEIKINLSNDGKITLIGLYSTSDIGVADDGTLILKNQKINVVDMGEKYDGISWNKELQKYEISNYNGLLTFAKIVNGELSISDILPIVGTSACAIISDGVDEIDASASNPTNPGYDATLAWVPIGNSSSPYTGTFDGNGCTIKGLTIDSSDNYIGLFGYVGEGGCVQNVNLEGGSIKGNSYVGGVAGYIDKGKVSNCYNTGAVSGIGRDGGVVGYNYYGTVSNCYNTGKVEGHGNNVGGVAGGNNGGTVLNCYNTGKVEGRGAVGGVVGTNTKSGTVENCYNTGDVEGNSSVGGVAGYNYGSGEVSNCYNTGDVRSESGASVGGVVGSNNSDCEVSNCYNTGDVTGSSSVGGLAGWNNNGTVSNCYYNKSICQIGAINGSDDGDNAKGLSTSQMTGENALSMSNMALSDSIWLTKALGGSDEGQYYLYYPQLKGFNYKADGTPETDSTKISSDNWPAKVEVKVSWNEPDSYTYDGSEKNPTVTSIIVGDDSIPDGASVSYSAYGSSTWGEPTSDAPDSPGQYKMECDVAGEKVTKYFSILSPEVDYAVSCLKSVNEKWKQSTESINSGKYKAVISWTEDGHANIEKEFDILPEPITLTADSRDTDIYDGTEKSVSGFTCSVEGLTFDGVSANGKGIKQGKYDVTFSGVTLNDTKDTTGNYVVTAITNGTLTIKKKVLKITADSASAECDGTALTKNSYTFSGLAKGDSVESVTITGSQTGPGSGDNVPSAATIVNAAGEDVTDCYDITYVNGTLTVSEHSFDQEVADVKYQKSAADCTHAAVYYKSCKCGERGTETFESGEPLGHDYKAVEGSAVAPTCEKAGKEADQKCESCGDVITGKEIPATGHTFDKEVTDAKYLKSAADCTHAAVYYKSCACGEKGTETFESGEPLGHDYKAVEGTAVAPTCEKPGKEADQKCERCGDVINGKEIPATGHTWKAATGYAPKTCEICGATEGDVIKYTVEGGNTIEFTQGDTNNVVRTYHRSEDDKHAIDHHKGVQIDGKDVKVDAKSGSVIITFDAATLSVGDHVIKVIFDDWVDELKLVIKAPVTPAVDPTPTTGDSSLPVLWVTMLLLSMAGAAVVVEKKRRRA